MKISRKRLLPAVAVCVGLVMSGRSAMAQQTSPPVASEQITRILASPDRSPADRTNDLRRHPQQMLDFIGIRPGIVAVDLSAAGGYTTELLARTIGPSGTVYGQSRPRDPDKPPTAPAASEGTAIRTWFPSGFPLGRRRAGRVLPRSRWRTARENCEPPRFRPRRSSRSFGHSRIPCHQSWQPSTSIS